MMTASDYIDWQRFSGTCATRLSDVDFLRLAERELSEEGTTVMLIHKLLHHSETFQRGSPQMNLNVWRETAATGTAAERSHFVERTVAALKAIGAKRAALILPSVEST